MLLFTRKPGQSITIQPEEGLDVTTPVGILFSQGPIEFRVNRIMHGEVNIGIAAHRQFCILHDELSPRSAKDAIERPKGSCHENLACNVFNLRIQRKWSTEDLANESQLTLTTICALESGLGVIDLDDLDRLAFALRVNLATLLREQDFR